MGDDLDLAKHVPERPDLPEWNPEFYEDVDFLRIVGELLSHENSFRGGRLVSAAPPALARLRELVGKRNADHPDWGVKLPKVLYLFNDFVDLCRPSEVALVITRRPFNEVVRSLSKRARYAAGDTMQELTPLLFMLDEVAARYAGPVLEVPYHGLLDDPGTWLRKLTDFTGMLYPFWSATDVVRPQLARFRSERDGHPFQELSQARSDTR
jgi:hypothetical protein